jgi:predicted TIM-barrel fold metal-dependent hydrolase
MKALAALPRAALKISGLGFVHRSWKIEQIRPIILEAIEIFGVSRCMFASDFPTDRLFGDFNRHLEAYHEIVADFTPDERKELFACNAARIYRLKGSSSPTHRIHQAS